MRYLYHETTREEKNEIDNALLCDSELQALYNELLEVKIDMDAATLEPSASTVLSILSYSKARQ